MARHTLGGDRLGAGKKIKVDTKTFNRSTHDLSHVLRTTMSAGTLVPFLCMPVLPGDTFDINLGCDVLTLPTIGPVFGSEKVQLDIFTAPVRLYQAQLHNNKVGIGMNMSAVKLPQITTLAPYLTETQLAAIEDVDNFQINPSSILSYLGMRGFGIPSGALTPARQRSFPAVSFLAYWDIVKCYYANKQETDAWVIHNEPIIPPAYVDSFEVTGGVVIPEWPSFVNQTVTAGTAIVISTTDFQDVNALYVELEGLGFQKFTDVFYVVSQTGSAINAAYIYESWGEQNLRAWRYREGFDVHTNEIKLTSFPLENIDKMREAILGAISDTSPFQVLSTDLTPYTLPFTVDGEFRSITGSQEGLAVKTYQSDIFNNWLNTEFIDGVNGITAVTSIDVSGGSLTIDSIVLHKKVYEMLNDILVSGGTYDDWQETVYDHTPITRAETPVYWGSLIKELQFQEVVSNSESNAGPDKKVQPLGTLAGRGKLGSKHKGGNIQVKVDEISWLIGIVSITPRLDYSQGNEWHTRLETMDDFHKGHLDQIGYQELITDGMAWWDTRIVAGQVTYKSAGKQPAWLHYQTDFNKVKGNFALKNNNDFMVFTRRYNPVINTTTHAFDIGDLTTYIDPTHFNNIFAQSTLDSQNYWVNIGMDITARRKMSARIMPNL